MKDYGINKLIINCRSENCKKKKYQKHITNRKLWLLFQIFAHFIDRVNFSFFIPYFIGEELKERNTFLQINLLFQASDEIAV